MKYRLHPAFVFLGMLGCSCFGLELDFYMGNAFNNRIYDLYVSEGKIYSGTQNGLIVWDLETGEPQAYPLLDGVPSDQVSHVRIKQSGELVLASERGVAYQSGSDWRYIESPIDSGLPFSVTSLTLTPNDNIVFGTRFHGLYRTHGSNLENLYYAGDTNNYSYVYNHVVDKNNSIWMQIYPYSYYRYDSGWLPATRPTGAAGTYVTDSFGNLFYVQNADVHQYQNGWVDLEVPVEVYTGDAILLFRRLNNGHSVILTEGGKLWYEKGDWSWNSHSYSFDDSFFKALSFGELPLAVQTTDTLFVLDENYNFSHKLHYNKSAAYGDVKDFAADGEGRAFFIVSPPAGSQDWAVSIYEGGNWNNIVSGRDSIFESRIHQLIRGESGKVYARTQGRVYQYEPSRATFVPVSLDQDSLGPFRYFDEKEGVLWSVTSKTINCHDWEAGTAIGCDCPVSDYTISDYLVHGENTFTGVGYVTANPRGLVFLQCSPLSYNEALIPLYFDTQDLNVHYENSDSSFYVYSENVIVRYDLDRFTVVYDDTTQIRQMFSLFGKTPVFWNSSGIFALSDDSSAVSMYPELSNQYIRDIKIYDNRPLVVKRYELIWINENGFTPIISDDHQIWKGLLGLGLVGLDSEQNIWAGVSMRGILKISGPETLDMRWEPKSSTRGSSVQPVSKITGNRVIIGKGHKLYDLRGREVPPLK